jgi:hypothetical protein
MVRLTYLRSASFAVAMAATMLLISSCGQASQQADAMFGDQNFKTSIALIELYHVRHGVYPEALTDLDFTGQWDLNELSAVEYHRLSDGYELDIARGWVGKPTLAYPPEFWQGLGLRRTNVTHTAAASR